MHPQTPERCAKHAFVFNKLSTTDSAWVAVGTSIPILLFSGIVVYTVASWGASRSVQRRRYIITTFLLFFIASFAFFLNMAFMKMMSCQPSVSEDLASVATMSVFGGDCAAGIALGAWLIASRMNYKAWKKEKQRRTSQAQRRIENLELQDYFLLSVANKKTSRSTIRSTQSDILVDSRRSKAVLPTWTSSENSRQSPSRPTSTHYLSPKTNHYSTSLLIPITAHAN